jgi:DNA mismatch endonuclease, patch repair protein
MRSIRSKDTRPEKVLFEAAKLALPRRKLMLHPSKLIGRPDLYVPSLRLVLFADGCLFHGCRAHCRIPPRNSEYWSRKIERNMARDRRVRRALRAHGYSVWSIWEHDLKAENIARVRRRIERIAARLLRRVTN